jgi:putative transcriptional regulator
MKNKSVIGRCLLLELLDKYRMSQSELSEMTGISRSQINEYISNTRRMSLHNARIIAHVLRCNIEDLYEWKLDKHRGK